MVLSKKICTNDQGDEACPQSGVFTHALLHYKKCAAENFGNTAVLCLYMLMFKCTFLQTN